MISIERTNKIIHFVLFISDNKFKSALNARDDVAGGRLFYHICGDTSGGVLSKAKLMRIYKIITERICS